MKKTQYDGIHHVKGTPERIWPSPTWSILVPSGHSYVMDDKITATGGMGQYLLQIQETNSMDFSDGYASSFNVVIYGKMFVLEKKCDDASDPELLDSLDGLPSHIIGQFQTFKRTKNVTVLYRIDNEDEDYSMYSYEIIARGDDHVYSGQFNCRVGSIAQRKNQILSWLDTIETVSEKEKLFPMDFSNLTEAKLPLSFEGTSVSIGSGIEIPVPEGFHFETNPTIIGEERCLAIVPSDYPFYLGAMNSPIALTVLARSFSIPTIFDKASDVFKAFCAIPGNFDANAGTRIYKHTDKAFTISQLSGGDGWIKTASVLFANDQVYLISIFLTYKENHNYLHKIWDIDRLSQAWLGRIRVDKETEFDTNNASTELDHSFTYQSPDISLYPHYSSLRSIGGMSISGARVVVNPGGTEYNFIPIKSLADDEDIEDSIKALYRRIVNSDTQKYKLHEKAKEIQALFHVNAAVFDSKHDRECELEEGLLHRAYMFSGLRSFAWTLADYCDRHNCSPNDINSIIASQIANFVADAGWLNYDGDTFCKGLCSGSDLHVYYLPDSITASDRELLLPSQEDYDRVRQMKERFPSYREILSEVHSLNALRKDLDYVYPAILVLWEKLRDNRNYDEPLLGNEADIVYAWCALALAAKGPFFTEDGPMTCHFKQLAKMESQVTPRKSENNRLGEARLSHKAVPVQQYNSEDFEIEDGVLKSYNGTNPVLNIPEGVTAIDEEFSPLYDELLTDIYFPDSLKSLPNSTFMGLTRFKNLRHIDLGCGIEKIGDCCFWGMNIEEIVIPGNVKSIGPFAFKDCKSLKKVTLENGIETIGFNAFSGTEIEEVFIPESVTEIGSDAFPIGTFIKGIRGSEVEIYAHRTPGCKYQLEGEDPNAFIIKKQEKGKDKQPEKNKPEEFVIEEGCLIKYVGENPYVKLPKDVKIVKASAFASSSVIQEVDLNSDELEEVEANTFSNCSRLEHLSFGGKLTIHNNTVLNCPTLKSIHIPRMVKIIEDGAFSNCLSLEWIYLPKTLKSASNEMIVNCPAFKRFRIDELNPHLKSINGAIVKRAKGELPKKHDDQLIVDDPIIVDDVLSLNRIEGLEYKKCHYDFLKADHIRVSGELKPGVFDTLFHIYFHFQQSHDWMFFEEKKFGIEKPKRYAVCDLSKDVFAELCISELGHSWQAEISAYIVSAKDRSYDFNCSEFACNSSAEARKKVQTLLLPALNRFMQSVFINGRNLNIHPLQYEDFKYSREELVNLIKDKPYSPDSLFVFPSGDCSVVNVQQSAKKASDKSKSLKADRAKIGKDSSKNKPVKNSKLDNGDERMDEQQTDGNRAEDAEVEKEGGGKEAKEYLKSHYLVMAFYDHHEPFFTHYSFSKDYVIAADPENEQVVKWFNWKSSNRPDYSDLKIMSGEEDGIASLVNFSCIVRSKCKDFQGGLLDTLLECEDKAEEMLSLLYADMNAPLADDQCEAIAILAINPQGKKWNFQMATVNYVNMTMNKETWEGNGTQKEVIEAAKHRMMSRLESIHASLIEKKKAEVAEIARTQEEARAKAEAEAREEAEAQAKADEERLVIAKARYAELSEEIRQQKEIISQNKGWFGSPARIRKTAQEKLRLLESQLQEEFPEGIT